MTIHAGWPKYFKTVSPNAHTKAPMFNAKTVFIDGQIKLMKQNDVRDWDTFINRQFAWPIRRYFTRGVDTVILAFDYYGLVPSAKSMTQRKRNANKENIDPGAVFTAGAPLPETLPEQWGIYIRNRVFKRKVIFHVIETLSRQARTMRDNQIIIIDYEEDVYYIQNHSQSSRASAADPAETRLFQARPRGEADIKFPEYTRHFENTILDAVDGDYLPIALIQRELNPEVRTCVYRIRTKVTNSGRDVEDDDAPGDTQRREYEYVDIDTLYNDLICAMHRSGRIPPSHRGHEMRMLAVLVAMSGSDFTQPSPRLAPTTIVKYIRDAMPRLVECYDPDAYDHVDVNGYSNALLASLYGNLFSRYTHARRGMHNVHRDIQLSTLAAGTKRKIPDDNAAQSLGRNINWLLHYWQPCDTDTPNPIQKRYGYVEDAAGNANWEREL